MKDALGHGSDAGAHSGAIRALPKMQRRHFEAIAAELRSRPNVGSPEHTQLVNQTADQLSTTNPNFRRDFFVAAATGGKVSSTGKNYNDKSRGRTSGMSKSKKVIASLRK